MVFNSFEYALFLPVVLLLYWRLSHRRQNGLLLIASYVFYGAWDWRFLGLLLITTLIDHRVALRLAATEEDRARKRWLLVSIVANLAILGFFKYFNFFVDSAASLLGTIGLEPTTPVLRVALPVGISFYTFQEMSYTIDVYRRRQQPVRSLLDFAVYVAYFPQLVAGPIQRAHGLLRKIQEPRARIAAAQVRSGLTLILLGLFRKIVIADGLAPYVEDTFAAAGSAGAVTLVVGAWAFALQIYGDFAGYIDIARGSSRLLGIELMRNFRQPYLSTNITAFWRTWHISLSSWLRDYLYVPLGGNRGGRARMHRNLMLTMLIGGLWHGAAWTFVVWGGIHGAYLIVHKLMRPTQEADATPRFRPRHILPAFATFNLVCVTWVFFRASSISEAFSYLQGIASMRGGARDLDLLALVVMAGLATLAIDLIQRNGISVRVHTMPRALQGVAYGAMATAVLVFSGTTAVPFIYFQF